MWLLLKVDLVIEHLILMDRNRYSNGFERFFLALYSQFGCISKIIYQFTGKKTQTMPLQEQCRIAADDDENQ